jgi:hypothetical protein
MQFTTILLNVRLFGLFLFEIFTTMWLGWKLINDSEERAVSFFRAEEQAKKQA